MTPKIELSALKKTKPWEYAVRFLFGGVITAVTGLIAHRWGPAVGGLFLGFPAILPAALTLVQQHDGRADAVDDARGARLGSVGLVAFAGVVWGAAGTWKPAAVLLVATLVWLVVDVALWAVRFARER